MPEMDPNPGPRRPSRVPWGVAGTLVLIVGIEAFASRSAAWITVPDAWGWRVAARAAAGPESGADLLCFGDSLVKLSLAPPVLERELGQSVYNLGLIGGRTPAMDALLGRVLESGRKPHAILLGLEPNVLAQNPEIGLKFCCEAMSLFGLLDMAWSSRDASMGAKAVLSKCLPTYRSRFEIRAYVRDPLHGMPTTLLTELTAPYERNWTVNRGAQLMAPGTGPPAPPGSDFFPYNRNWRCHPTEGRYLKRFLARAEAAGIPVFWILMPYDVPPAHEDKATAFNEVYTNFAKRLADRYANVTIVDARSAGLPSRLYYDGLHLSRDGAGLLSKALADLMRTTPDPELSRWLDLPPISPQQPIPRLEDVDASKLALTPSETIRR